MPPVLFSFIKMCERLLLPLAITLGNYERFYGSSMPDSSQYKISLILPFFFQGKQFE